MNDLGNIPEVSVDFMLNHIVPDFGVDVEHTMRKLREEGNWLERIHQGIAQTLQGFLEDGKDYKGIINSTKLEGSPRTPTLVFEYLS